MSHWGIFHWLSACWHRTSEVNIDPGHGIAEDRKFIDCIWKCCKCDRTRPFGLL